jgi:predicted nucleic-acid-binding Zn-ribbon protein
MYDPVRKAVIDASNKCSLQCSKCGREWYRNNKVKVPGELLTIDKF